MTPSPVQAALRLVMVTIGAASSFPFPVSAQASSPRLTVEYLANEGVLLTSGTTQVLIDGLFGDGLPGYATVAQPVRASLEQGLGRFGEIDLVLVTHVHRDHFNARSLARHLRANPETHLAGSTQVRDSLRLLASWTDPTRTLAIRPDPNRPASFRIGELTVEAHGIPHPPSRNEPVEHLVWVITMNGVRVMHAGDSSPTPAELRSAAGPGIDLLLAPNWILGGTLGAERIAATRASQVAAIHLSRPDSALPSGRAVQLLQPGQRLGVQ